MIARNRHLPVHDFLLVAFSVAVIVLSKWPEAQPRQWVQLRQRDGTLRQYSLAEHDPSLAKLRLAMEKWAKAGQETRLAVAQWRAELADFYAERTESAPIPSSNPIRTVSHRNPAGQPDQDSQAEDANSERVRQSQHEYWVRIGQQARDEIAKVQEIRRSRKALEIPPPIVFGPLEPGGKPGRALMVSPAIGLLVALGFAVWAFVCPTLRLPARVEDSPITPQAEWRDSCKELRLVVPADWVRIRQPIGVTARWGAIATIVLIALVSVLN